MMTVIETARCYVREFSVSCIPEVFRLYEGEHFTDYIEPLLSVEEETEYRENYIKKIYGKYGYGMWDVFDKETGRLIGEAGLEHRTDSDREKFPYDWMFDEHCAELGYCIANDLWGQGYCTEVCKEILRYGTKKLGLKVFFARAQRENAASVRVLEKLGFINLEGIYYRREGLQ